MPGTSSAAQLRANATRPGLALSGDDLAEMDRIAA